MKKKINKTECIMNALNAGQKITALVAWKLCKTLTLSEIIRDLRHKYGMKIKTDWKTENGCRFAEYSLVKGRK